MNVIIKAEHIESAFISGQVSVEYSGPRESATPICFKLDHHDTFDSVETTEFADVVLNRHTIHDHIFKLNTQLFSNENQQQYVCVQYQKKLEKEHVPITVIPRWKCEDSKSRLLLKCHCQSVANLSDLQHITLTTSVTGHVQSAMSIPLGELDLSQNTMQWNLNQTMVEDECVIKAQFATQELGTPQPIIVHFETEDQLFTDTVIHQSCSDPLLLWAKVSGVTKRTVSGTYKIFN